MPRWASLQNSATRKLLHKLGLAPSLRVCYEAGPPGYVLYWPLTQLGREAIRKEQSKGRWTVQRDTGAAAASARGEQKRFKRHALRHGHAAAGDAGEMKQANGDGRSVTIRFTAAKQWAIEETRWIPLVSAASRWASLG